MPDSEEIEAFMDRVYKTAVQKHRPPRWMRLINHGLMLIMFTLVACHVSLIAAVVLLCLYMRSCDLEARIVTARIVMDLRDAADDRKYNMLLDLARLRK